MWAGRHPCLSLFGRFVNRPCDQNSAIGLFFGHVATCPYGLYSITTVFTLTNSRMPK